MTWMDRLADGIRRATPFRGNEAGTAALMFAYSFMAMTAYNILKPLTRAKFIAVLGADNLPYVQLAAGLLIGLLMHLHGVAIERLPRRHVIPVTQAGIIALLVLFWGLFRTGAPWVPVAFYVFGLILGILLISQFWTLANDIYDARQAKRLFGFIGGGASLGGASGAAITAFVVDEVGSDNLLLVSAATLAVCAAIVMAIVRRHHLRPAGAVEEECGVGGSEALRLLMESRQLQMLSLVIGFAAAGALVVEQQLNMAAEALHDGADSDAIAQFLAHVSVYLSLAGFMLQIFLTSRIHRSCGIAVALLMLPITLGISATLILFTGAPWVVAGARVADATLRYTLDKTTREVLFLPLPSELKYRAKPFIDVTMDRLSKAGAALLVLVLIKPWGLGLDWHQLSYASLAMMTVWIVTAVAARREYLRSFRSSLGAPPAVAGSAQAPATDGATIKDPHASVAIYAIEHPAPRRPDLAVPVGAFEKAIVAEASHYCRYFILQHGLRQHPQVETSLLWRTLDDKLARTIDRLYRLLGLLQGEDIAVVRDAIEHGDARRRASALEYLDNVLGASLRKRVLPLIDESSATDRVRHASHVAGTQPRSVDDTLAQLMRDDDEVVASAAVQFVGEQASWDLTGKLEHAAAHALAHAS